VDLIGALVALDGAIQGVKASKTAVSLAQLKPVAQTVSRALVMAEAFGVEPESQERKATCQFVGSASG